MISRQWPPCSSVFCGMLFYKLPMENSGLHVHWSLTTEHTHFKKQNLTHALMHSIGQLIKYLRNISDIQIHKQPWVECRSSTSQSVVCLQISLCSLSFNIHSFMFTVQTGNSRDIQEFIEWLQIKLWTRMESEMHKISSAQRFSVYCQWSHWMKLRSTCYNVTINSACVRLGQNNCFSIDGVIKLQWGSYLLIQGIRKCRYGEKRETVAT